MDISSNMLNHCIPTNTMSYTLRLRNHIYGKFVCVNASPPSQHFSFMVGQFPVFLG